MNLGRTTRPSVGGVLRPTPCKLNIPHPKTKNKQVSNEEKKHYLFSITIC